jgi:hypothetical protein
MLHNATLECSDRRARLPISIVLLMSYAIHANMWKRVKCQAGQKTSEVVSGMWGTTTTM